MASEGVMAYGLIAVLIVYYSASFEIAYAPKHNRWRTYISFFVLSMVTVIVEMLHNLSNTSDTISQTVMMWGVIGPVYDLLWSDWPGNGSLVLWTSQLVFVLSATDVYRWVIAAVMILTTAVLAIAGWTKSRHTYTRLPSSVVDSM